MPEKKTKMFEKEEIRSPDDVDASSGRVKRSSKIKKRRVIVAGREESIELLARTKKREKRDGATKVREQLTIVTLDATET